MFITGLQYETNSEDVRRMFEEHGDIKTFFDLISTRGMVFVTYVSMRSERNYATIFNIVVRPSRSRKGERTAPRF